MKVLPAHPDQYPQLVEIWEASVRATHHFLTEADIQFFKPMLAKDFFPMVELVVAQEDDGHILGFAGVADHKIEMLFIRPECRGQGIGKQLLFHAIHQMGATKVDVNEQNEQAVSFYQHMEFEVAGRSDLDGMGKPFPLLHLSWSPNFN